MRAFTVSMTDSVRSSWLIAPPESPLATIR